MKRKKDRSEKSEYRFGIGEWYGRLFVNIDPDERKRLAEFQFMKKKRPDLICPFRSTGGSTVPCRKEGGVCTIRLYRQAPGSQHVAVAAGKEGQLVTLCPHRFRQQGTIIKWVGETLLGHAAPLVAKEVGFLRPEPRDEEDNAGVEQVGRIDNVLVHPKLDPLQWCTLEIQAVYFSGPKMREEFEMLRSYVGQALPFPAAKRRPDYRSSGPKRLMPQLQIKVPTLRRWGKKMAVVVDRSFFGALGRMDDVKNLSNADIAWFVVRYDDRQREAILKPDFLRLTTLERAVEGLTAGLAVSLEDFEARIRAKLPRTQ